MHQLGNGSRSLPWWSLHLQRCQLCKIIRKQMKSVYPISLANNFPDNSSKSSIKDLQMRLPVNFNLNYIVHIETPSNNRPVQSWGCKLIPVQPTKPCWCFARKGIIEIMQQFIEFLLPLPSQKEGTPIRLYYEKKSGTVLVHNRSQASYLARGSGKNIYYFSKYK